MLNIQPYKDRDYGKSLTNIPPKCWYQNVGTKILVKSLS